MFRSIRVFLAVLMAIAVVVVCQTPAPSHECQPHFIGDGYCDKATNNVEEVGGSPQRQCCIRLAEALSSLCIL